MAILKVEIPDDIMSRLEEDMIETGLNKKQLVESILRAYYCDASARDVLFGFDLLRKVIDE